MVLKEVGRWVGVGVWAALISYLISRLMHEQTMSAARLMREQTIGDVNDLMEGIKHYAKTHIGGIE